MPSIAELQIYSSSAGRYFEDFVCSYCGADTNGALIARGNPNVEGADRRWLMCTRCGEPSLRDMAGQQWPAPMAGPSVPGMPDDVAAAYQEARRCHGVGAFTASELMSRKILMYLAIDVADAEEGMKFFQYIDALAGAGYVTPPMKPWVKLIKDRGNEATHELPHVDEERARSTLEFTGRLLALSYEMSHLAGEFTDEPEDEPVAE